MFISSLLNDAKFTVFWNHLEGWLKHRLFCLAPELLILLALSGTQGSGTSNRFLGDAAVSGPGTTHGEPLVWRMLLVP